MNNKGESFFTALFSMVIVGGVMLCFGGFMLAVLVFIAKFSYSVLSSLFS